MGNYLIASAVPIYVGAVFLLTHIPDRYLPRLTGLEGLLHAAAYGGLAFLIWASLMSMARFHKGIVGHTWRTISTLLLVGIVGLADELTQPMTGRRFQWQDLAADMLGALSILALLIIVEIAKDRAPTGRWWRLFPWSDLS